MCGAWNRNLCQPVEKLANLMLKWQHNIIECNINNLNEQNKPKNLKSRRTVSLLTVSISSSFLQHIQCPKNRY